MKLQTSIQPRRDGTVKVEGQDRQTYVFVADEDGELSCEIGDEATIARLIASDLFYPANPDDADAALKLVQAKAVVSPEILLGSNSFDAVLNVGGKEVQLGTVVARAHSASGLTVEAWNALSEQERDDLIESELDKMDEEAEQAGGGLPVESNTPPQTSPDKAAKSNAAAQRAAKASAKK